MQQNSKYFPVWSISREDTVSVLSGGRDHGSQWWPHHLSDAQMGAIALRMQKYLEGSMDDQYWAALLDAVEDGTRHTFIQLKEAA